ncbi:hypothetical protein ACFL04_04725 [Patescibacteria group bacterium]
MKLQLLIMIVSLTAMPMSVFGQSISDHYIRVSGPESFFADATTQGHTTTNMYTGKIEVLVGGTWYNSPSDEYDAWYRFRYGGQILPSPTHDGHAMTIGFDGCSWVQECGGTNIRDWTIFHEGVGFVTPGFTAIPEYSDTHVYHFVMDIDTIYSQITLGVGDGGVYDNSGGMSVTLYQLQEHPVPVESSTWGAIKATYQ